MRNDANQRTRRADVDGSYWVYNNDTLGQVTAGKKYWADGTPVAGQQFEYTFDDIGNRKSTKSGGDENGANLRSATYTANNLNQYTSRGVPGYVDILGLALATNTVTVNGTTAYRRGEYFRSERSVSNNLTAVWTNLIVAAAGETSVTGNVFVAKSPEAFGYDLDGNLTNDGRWVFTWDAENRLTQIESLTNGPTASKRRVTWQYDGKGRRQRQTTYNLSSGSAVVTEDLKFVNDGWRCLAELNGTNNALVRRYTWGLDLSGSMDGAGGVGGLLWMKADSDPQFCAYDGNGNVAGLVRGSTGDQTAAYEYDPFGRTIRMTGSLAQSNPFRFSTKRANDTTDLVLYEYRVYNPSTGRWLSRDPLGERGGINMLGFVLNNPVSFADSSGLSLIGGGYGQLPLPKFPPEPRPVVVVTVPKIPEVPDHNDNGAENSVNNGANSHAKEEGYTVLTVEDISDANKQIKALPNCCVKELNIAGHGAGNGQWVGSSQTASSHNKWVGVSPNASGGYDEVGFQLFDGIKFCKPCTIWLRGCMTTKGPAGEAMLKAIAKKTGCTVKGFSVNSTVGSDGLSCPNLGWWYDRAATDSASP